MTKVGAHQAGGLIIGRDHGLPSLRFEPSQPDKRYKKALDIMNREGEVDKAYLLLEGAANGGDAHSKYALGTWYLHGFFLKKNIRAALKLLREAADENVAAAAFDLAVCYETGVGVNKNIGKAGKYYLRAFIFGDIDGASGLERLLYWKGQELNNRKLSKEFGRAIEISGCSKRENA